eukprot:COSAG04_NODE_36_length_34202_cov_16.186904_9_plen_397_part_00
MGTLQAMVEDVERRLSCSLPATFRAFLQEQEADGGTAPTLGPDETPALAPAELVWARDSEPLAAFLSDWNYSGPSVSEAQHRVYGEAQDPVIFRREYIDGCLLISEVDPSGFFLLSPAVTSEEGEWECWHFASWYPGAARWPSFDEMVSDLRGDNLFSSSSEDEGGGGDSDGDAAEESERSRVRRSEALAAAGSVQPEPEPEPAGSYGDAVRIEQRAGKGDALVAARSFALAAELFAEEPLLAWSNPESDRLGRYAFTQRCLQQFRAATPATQQKVLAMYHSPLGSGHPLRKSEAKLAALLAAEADNAELTEGVIAQLLATVTTNAHEYHQASGEGAHAALFTVGCKANHSCSPNAAFSTRWGDGKQHTHAITEIRRGDELCVCYLDDETLWTTPR